MGEYRSDVRPQPRRPRRVLGRAAAGVNWRTEPPPSSTRVAAPFYRWFPDGVLNTCYNALDRHVAAGRGDRSRAHLRQPGHRHRRAPSPTRELLDAGRAVRRRAARARRRQGRPGRHLHADGPRGGRRDARLRAARRGALGRVRRLRRRRARGCASTTPSRRSSSRRRAASSRRRVVEYKPLLDQALELAAHQPEHVRGPAAPAGEAATRGAGATSTGTDADAPDAEPADCVPVAATDPLYVLYTSGTTGQPKGIVRDNGGHAVALRLVDAQHLRHRRRRRVVDGVRRRLGRRPLLHRLRAAAGRRDDRALRGQAGRHAGRRRVLAGHRASTASRRCSPRRPRSGRSRRRTRTASSWRRTTCRRCSTLFLAGERLDPDTYAVGHRAARRPGGRPLVADRDRLADRRQPARPRADADQARLAVGAGARLRRAGPRPARRRGRRPAPRARSASSCRCRRARCRRCGATTSGSSRRTCRPSTATT